MSKKKRTPPPRLLTLPEWLAEAEKALADLDRRKAALESALDQAADFDNPEYVLHMARKHLADAQHACNQAQYAIRQASRQPEGTAVPDAQIAHLKTRVRSRRRELEYYRRLMTETPAGSQHRGTRSFRRV